MRVCSKCGIDIPLEMCYDRPECQNCRIHQKRLTDNSEQNKERYKRHDERQIRLAEAQYDVWQERIAAVPKDYHTLTEDEWHDVVDYFDGKCAFCQNHDFTQRGLFMLVSQNGRYCNWNVIPICDECIVRPKHKSPFRFMNQAYTGPKSTTRIRGYNTEKLNKIIQYLEPKLLEAMASGDAQQVEDNPQ